MKTINFMVAALLAVIMGTSSFAQTPGKVKSASTKTITLKVSGNCEMCKARIEKAAKVDGISKADWNIKTKILTLVYDPAKVKTDDVLKKVAAVGHDNEKFKADEKAYKALPACCKYK